METRNVGGQITKLLWFVCFDEVTGNKRSSFSVVVANILCVLQILGQVPYCYFWSDRDSGEESKKLTMTHPVQRTYVQKDGTIVPHTARPLSARFNELISSLLLFLTLFWQSLFQAPPSFMSVLILDRQQEREEQERLERCKWWD